MQGWPKGNEKFLRKRLTHGHTQQKQFSHANRAINLSSLFVALGNTRTVSHKHPKSHLTEP